MGTAAETAEAGRGVGTVLMRKEKPGVQPERLVKEQGREAGKRTGERSGNSRWGLWTGAFPTVGGLTFQVMGCEEGTCDF